MHTKSYGALVASLSFVLFWSGLAFGAEELLVADKATGCRVFKPNAKPTDTVTWRGKCVSGFADGPGTAEWFSNGQPEVRFDGTFKAGRLQGKGLMVGSGGDRYEGEYKDGLRDGRGVYVFANGGRYEGEYKANLRDGKGLLTDAQGNRMALEFKNGQKIAEAPAPASNKGAIAADQPKSASVDSDLAARPRADGATGQLTMFQCYKGVFAEVWALIPRSIDLKTGPAKGDYPLERLPIPSLQPVLEQAYRFALERCELKAKAPEHTVAVKVFYDKVPPINDTDRASRETVYSAAREVEKPIWRTFNTIAFWETPEGKADLQQRQQRDLQVQNAKNAEIAMKGKKDEFLKRYGAIELERVAPLFTNPFAFEGKTVLLTVQFGEMTSATTGFFEVLATLRDRGGTAIVSDIPRGALMEPTRLVIAAQVLGKTKVQGPMPMETLHLKLIGFEKCVQDRCPF